MPPIIGPYRTIEIAEGTRAPLYIIPFDKKGRCKAPRTRNRLIDSLEHEQYSHVFLFSHGWNNDWDAASGRYFDFASGFTKLRRELNLAVSDHYKPLLVGIFWPSTWLVSPWERAPEFAAPGPGSELSDLVSDWAAELPDAQVERFYRLTDSEWIDVDDAHELAALVAPLLRADDEVGDSAEITAEELLRVWQSSPTAAEERTVDDDDDSFGTVGESGGAPAAAGWADKLDPRKVLRMASVWQMKDRAGRIGAKGVSPLLFDILRSGDHSVHLIGHSYGGKVVLSATAYQELPRAVESMLLLQPAVSRLCFAASVAGTERAGGYRLVLERVKQPIVTTFSERDVALTKAFHLAVRRDSDLGEQRIASPGGPPSRYAALGGFGPGGLGGELQTVAMRDPGEAYDELDDANLEVLALNGDLTIDGHGDISNPSTWWALLEQARRAGSV
ncbi:MAG: hypothetical protein ACK5HY_17665 [Parahaliea sp.]